MRANDTVAVCAPAGPVRAARLRTGLGHLEGRFRVRFEDPGVFSASGYLAGDDDRRADELNRYLADPDVRAILVARGGYGIMRILDRLDVGALRRDPKLIVGFSDATALLCWALARAGVRGIHGPVAAQLGELGPADEAWLYELMEKPEPQGRLDHRFDGIGSACRERREGRLVGGNLCILSHLVATPYQVDLAGAVLFFEDVGERPYAVDRYLTRLAIAGALDGIEAALVGDFLHCEETIGPPAPDVWTVVDERLRKYGHAGLRGLPVGHGDRNLALPFAARCAVDFARGEVHLLEPAVS